MYLIHIAFSRKQGLPKNKLRKNTTKRPGINGCGVICCSKDQFRSAVVSGANVCNIGLALNKHFRTAKVTQLHDVCIWVEKQILGLNVSMTNSNLMYVSERPCNLIHIQLKADRIQML